MLKFAQTALLFLAIFFIFLNPMRDTDFGWHYRCGQELATQKQFCNVNRYTVMLDGYSWNSPSQGYDLLLYSLYRNFSFPGVTIFYALSAALVFTFFVKSFKEKWLAAALLTLVGVWFSWSILGLGFRSQIVSVYFLAVFLAVIKLSRLEKRYLFALPLLSLLWVNSHSGFFLGPLVVFVFLLDQGYRLWRKQISLKDFKFTLTVFGLTILATLLNPLGFSVYQEVLRHAQVPLNTLIAEWLPPAPGQILFIISLVALVVSLLSRGRRPDVLGILSVLFFGLLAADARRNLPLFALAAAFALAQTGPSTTETGWHRFRMPTLLAFTLLALFFAYKNVPGVLNYDERIYAQKALVTLPYDGVRFMNTLEPGSIFNAYEWGGYLIWKLPKFKIFTDGRMPSWDTNEEKSLPQEWRGKSPYTVYIETVQTQPGWQEVLKGYDFQYIMIQSGAYLDLTLKEMGAVSGFNNIYDRDGVSIFKRSR